MNKILDTVTGLTKNDRGEIVQGEARQNREEFIFRPRRNRGQKGEKTFVLVSGWDTRHPDISQILRGTHCTEIL